jgi:hypothetical protein
VVRVNFDPVKALYFSGDRLADCKYPDGRRVLIEASQNGLRGLGLDFVGAVKIRVTLRQIDGVPSHCKTGHLAENGGAKGAKGPDYDFPCKTFSGCHHLLYLLAWLDALGYVVFRAKQHAGYYRKRSIRGQGSNSNRIIESGLESST